ncbi:MAG: fibronectin type III domain-containing protein, partial [Thermoplasmata archaeon]|nr:fibronectin type III domain-containing protein [Thermoplasmata archaeon]
MTEPITLPVDKRWDILDLDSTRPSNTSVILTILDSERKPIPGFSGLTDMNLDLAGLEEHETIHVEVKLVSTSNTTTPVLDRLLVNWMDKWEWREEFYGVAKIATRIDLDVRDDELRRAQDTAGPENGSYLSKAFGPEDTREAETFHTLRYTARLGSSQSGEIRLVDAVTSEVVAKTPLLSGSHEWSLTGAFSLKDHPSIQINVTAEGLDVAGEFALDDIWINWTYRLNLPPTIIDIWPGEPTVKRTKTVQLYVNVSDDYDTTHNLTVEVQHRLHSSDVWSIDLFHPTQREKCEDGLWIFYINPPYHAALGLYAFRVNVTDKDDIHSGFIEFAPMLEVVPNLPSEPYNLIVVASDSEVELVWRPPLDTGDSSLTGYRIYRGRSNDSLDLLATMDSSTTTYFDNEVENGVSYFYAVLACTEWGNGTLSDGVEARPAGPPSVPLNLTAVPGDEKVTLKWDPPEKDGGFPVESYYVHKGTTGDTITWEADVTQTEFTITGLVNGQTYYFTISALNQIGKGPETEIISATPTSLSDAPRELTATAKTEMVTLRWKAPIDTGGLDVLEFVIYRGEDPDSLEELISVSSLSSMFNDNGVEGGVTYYYAVAAVTAFGEGPKSEVVSAMPLGPPGIPRNLIVDAGDGQVTLTWSTPEMDGGSPVTIYEIMRGSSPDDLSVYAQVLDTLSYLDDDVTNDQTYYYAVIAINDVSEGLPTEAVPATPYRPPTVPGRVFSLTVEAKGGKVELVWAAPEDDGGS